MRVCYCGKCEAPVFICTQWDCPGADNSYGVKSHDYDCEFCENRRNAFIAKRNRTTDNKKRKAKG